MWIHCEVILNIFLQKVLILILFKGISGVLGSNFSMMVLNSTTLKEKDKLHIDFTLFLDNKTIGL